MIMFDDNKTLNITSLQTQYMTPPPSVPPDKVNQVCHTSTVPIINEHDPANSEDKVDEENQFILRMKNIKLVRS